MQLSLPVGNPTRHSSTSVAQAYIASSNPGNWWQCLLRPRLRATSRFHLSNKYTEERLDHLHTSTYHKQFGPGRSITRQSHGRSQWRQDSAATNAVATNAGQLRSTGIDSAIRTATQQQATEHSCRTITVAAKFLFSLPLSVATPWKCQRNYLIRCQCPSILLVITESS